MSANILRSLSVLALVSAAVGCAPQRSADVDSPEVGVTTSAIRCANELDCLLEAGGGRCVQASNGQLECVECLNDLDCWRFGFGGACSNEHCVDPDQCVPQCNGRCGGSDGCGGTCPNTCASGSVCRAGACVRPNECVPQCSGRCGGSDGCGGACPNTCASGSVCQSGRCVSQAAGLYQACRGDCGDSSLMCTQIGPGGSFCYKKVSGNGRCDSGMVSFFGTVCLETCPGSDADRTSASCPSAAKFCYGASGDMGYCVPSL